MCVITRLYTIPQATKAQINDFKKNLGFALHSLPGKINYLEKMSSGQTVNSEMSIFRHRPSEGRATQARPGLCSSALAWTMTKYAHLEVG